MRLSLFVFSVSFFVAIIACSEKTVFDFPENGQWIDLSYSFDAQTPYWPTSNGFQLDTVFEGTTAGGYYYSAYAFQSAEHGGTHIDAPVHFGQGKNKLWMKFH